VWAWRAFEFSNPQIRERFFRTGQLSRSVPKPPTC
jgi:site-specific DNA-cytosine methylase